MALTFLQAMNETLKRVGIIQGEGGELASFSDSPRQQDIDVMIQAWNEVIQDLFKYRPKPKEIGESTFTLATGTREYDLASDFEGFITNPLNESDGHKIYPYRGGYVAMVEEQLQPSNYEGQPYWYVINPVNGKIRLDTAPTSDNNGDVYTYRYTKRIALSSITDTFPFSDTVVENLYPAVAQAWSLNRKETFSPALYDRAMALATISLNEHEVSTRY